MAITPVDLEQLERFADRIFSKVGIDVAFTHHFLQRANDERNDREIMPAELTRLFKQEYRRWGKPIAQMGPDAEGVMQDTVTNINVPFALLWDRDNQELDLVAKTIMRTDDFKTADPVFAIEDSPFAIAKRYIMPKMYGGSYKQAAARLHRTLSAIKGNLNHDPMYYAMQVARVFEKMDTRTLFDYYKKKYGDEAILEFEQPKAVITPVAEAELNIFQEISESRQIKQLKQINGMRYSKFAERFFEQLLALQMFAQSDPAYAAQQAADIMKWQDFKGFRIGAPDLYNLIVFVMKPDLYKDRIKKDVEDVIVPELRLKRNLRAIAKGQFSNEDYSYMMMMLQREMQEYLPAPLIQMRRQASQWRAVKPQDKAVIKDRLMLQMREPGLQSDAYEHLRRTKFS